MIDQKPKPTTVQDLMDECWKWEEVEAAVILLNAVLSLLLEGKIYRNARLGANVLHEIEQAILNRKRFSGADVLLIEQGFCREKINSFLSAQLRAYQIEFYSDPKPKVEGLEGVPGIQFLTRADERGFMTSMQCDSFWYRLSLENNSHSSSMRMAGRLIFFFDPQSESSRFTSLPIDSREIRLFDQKNHVPELRRLVNLAIHELDGGDLQFEIPKESIQVGQVPYYYLESNWPGISLGLKEWLLSTG